VTVVWTAALAIFLGREKGQWIKIVGVGCSAGGAIVVVLSEMYFGSTSNIEYVFLDRVCEGERGVKGEGDEGGGCAECLECVWFHVFPSFSLYAGRAIFFRD
jgi:hypothetical protein